MSSEPQLELLQAAMREQLELRANCLEKELEYMTKRTQSVEEEKAAVHKQLALLSSWQSAASSVQSMPFQLPHAIAEDVGDEKLPAKTQPKKVEEEPTAVNKEALDKAELNTKLWIKSCGLHTVSDWMQNYRKHPAGWGALLMIHGIPEVTNRLRTKVQNYAVFASLFLASSIKAVTAKWPACSAEPDLQAGECQFKRRVYGYALVASIASHILTILLAMAFHNALNETARDSDVYRMFARGKGFKATEACQRSFRAGIIFCCISLLPTIYEHTSWDSIIVVACATAGVVYTYRTVSHKLFINGSIVSYWRVELGGKPDDDDPYDITVPVDHFMKRVAAEWAQVYTQHVDSSPTDGMSKARYRCPSVDPSRSSFMPGVY